MPADLSHRDLWVPMSFTPVEKNSEGKTTTTAWWRALKPD